jgi:uncharacterized small protein (DUF1192 family)
MDDESARDTQFSIGDDLYSVSIGELRERIVLLEEEISRLTAEIKKKTADKDAAHNLFSRPS